MNKLIIALGLTLAASTGAFAQTTASDALSFPPARSAGIDYTATAATGTETGEKAVYDRAGNDGSPHFEAPQGGVDYTPTASINAASNEQIIYDRAGNDGSPRFK
ncbi:hypothetical protein OEG84_07195 [Hoeflea sp. G2-23]|uniref:Uncharacterized protein n=1 Tax=Hoeflea algicola TaxID=2983763 RepID=A0ABT3Z6V8_9HYPH|nr:hypothetical protein [Hoeflea algicola]MCY0147504.1 hypothetical protein [Hoeflea algicola]